MRRHPTPPVLRQRVPSRLLILIAAMGYRRWLSHPWQLTLGHCMVVVAGVAIALVLLRLPRPIVSVLLTLAVAVFASLRSRWHGFRIADIGMLLAIIFLAVAILLPAMVDTQRRTAGRRYFPFTIPQHFVERLYGRG